MADQLAEVCFTREVPDELKARQKWMLEAIRFMRVRSWLGVKWVGLTSGILEGRLRMPKPVPNFDPTSLKLANNIKDLYHYASSARGRFLRFVDDVVNKVKPGKNQNVLTCDNWDTWEKAVVKADHAKATAAVASVAELDEVHIAAINVPMKDRDRTAKKAKENYDGKTDCVTDVLRSSIVCNSDQDIAEVMKVIADCTAKYEPLFDGEEEEKGEDQSENGDKSTASGNSEAKGFKKARNIGKGIRVTRVRNRFKNSCFNGYRDCMVLLAFDVEDDHDEFEHHAESHLHLVEKPPKRVVQILCEIQVHHRALVRYANTLQSYSFYTYFRDFFGSSDTGPESSPEERRDFTNKLKALKTMDQVGEFIEALEGSVQVYLGGVGRVGRDLPRLSAYFQLFARVGEPELAEAMQQSIIKQLRGKDELKGALFKELSILALYFKRLKRYKRAISLSEEAMNLCIELHGQQHLDTAEQLSNHSDLLYCCGHLSEAMSLFERGLAVKQALLGEEHPLVYSAITKMAELYDDNDRPDDAMEKYDKVLSIHRNIARKSKTGQAGPEVADTLIEISHLLERQGLFQRSFKLLNEATQIYEDFYGPIHESRAACLTAQANLYDQQNRLNDALRCHKQALALREQLFKENASYFGFALDDMVNNPPWLLVAQSHHSCGEVLAELGEVEPSIAAFEKAIVMLEELSNNPEHHKNCGGTENAKMSYAATASALAMQLLVRGQPKFYPRCKKLLNEAYAIRMKYTSIRSLCTEQTIGVQGILDELIEDHKYHVEEHIAEKMKQQKEDEKREKRRGGQAESQINEKLVAMGKSDKTRFKSMSSDQRLKEIQAKEAEQQRQLDKATYPDIDTATTTAAAIATTTKNNKQGPDTLTESTLDASSELEGASVISAPETADPDQYWHLPARKTIEECHSRVHINKNMLMASEQLDSAEGLMELGEYKSAAKTCRQALENLLPLAITEPRRLLKEKEKKHIAYLESIGEEEDKASRKVRKKREEDEEKLFDMQEKRGQWQGAERRLATAVALSYHGCAYEDSGAYLYAVELFRQSLELLEEVYGADYNHMDIAGALANLGHVVHKAGEGDRAANEKALVYLHRARNMYILLEQAKAKDVPMNEDEEQKDDEWRIEKRMMGTAYLDVFGANIPEVFRIDHTISIVLFELGRPKDAALYIQQALNAKKEHFGTEYNVDYVASMNVRVFIECALGDFERAELSATESLKQRIRVFGTADPGYTIGNSSWAVTLFLMDDLALAGRIFTENIEARERQQFVGSQAVLTGLKNMTNLFHRQQDTANADPFMKGIDTVTQLCTRVFGPQPAYPQDPAIDKRKAALNITSHKHASQAEIMAMLSSSPDKDEKKQEGHVAPKQELDAYYFSQVLAKIPTASDNDLQAEAQGAEGGGLWLQPLTFKPTVKERRAGMRRSSKILQPSVDLSKRGASVSATQLTGLTAVGEDEVNED